MIIVERDQQFVMITQYEHSLLSGLIARSFREDCFIGIKRRKDVIYAITNHDHCWILLDETPFWDDRHQVPYSFYSFPLVPKLTFYRQGLEEMQLINTYAALLCSLHFASFYNGTGNPYGKEYFQQEQNRQQKLKDILQIHDDELTEQLQFHFRLLQFCDDLSLYICLNEPGAMKEDEHPWYSQGFSQKFSCLGDEQTSARWKDNQTIALSASPLQPELEISLTLKEVPKFRIKQMGIAQAYKHTPDITRNIRLVSEQI